MSADLAYYQRRLEQTRQAAAGATSEDTRVKHKEMALLYEKMLEALSSGASKAG